MPDRIRVTVAGVEPAGCAGAAELNGDYILDAVDRHTDLCRWEVSFPAKCRLFRMGLIATPNPGGGIDLRASLEGAVAGPGWIASGVHSLGGIVSPRFDRGKNPNPSVGCLWPETVAVSAIPAATTGTFPTSPGPVVSPKTASTVAGPHYISPEPSPQQMAAMAALATSSGSCQLTGIDPGTAICCIGSNQSFTALGMNLGDVQWSTSPAGNPATGKGGSFTTQWTTSGSMTVTASCGGVTKTANVTVVEVKSITVVSGATQTGVIGAKNWAAVKNASGNVIVEVTLNPNTDEAAAKITWSVGEAIPSRPRKRKISKASSAKINVRVNCGTSSADLTLWILWGTVTIKMDGTTPPNAVQFDGNYDGTEKLGSVSYNGGIVARGKVIPIAQLSPAGVHDVVPGGWAFKREVWGHNFIDGQRQPGFYNTAWVDDTSLPREQVLEPDDNDKIYDNDAPNVSDFGGVRCTEVYDNFRQWIEWNGEVASVQYVYWSWTGKWKAGGMPEKVILKQLSGTQLTLPDNPQGCD